MFFSFIITPVFLVHKTQFVILLLISWTSSFLQNFVSYISTCTWTQSELCHHKNIEALNVCTFACALTLKIRNDYTFHTAPTFGGVSSHRAESASNLIYRLNRVLVRSVVDGCGLMCMPICSPYLILNLLPKTWRRMSRLSYPKHEYPVRVPTAPLYFIYARPSTLSICRCISYVGLPL